MRNHAKKHRRYWVKLIIGVVVGPCIGVQLALPGPMHAQDESTSLRIAKFIELESPESSNLTGPIPHGPGTKNPLMPRTAIPAEVKSVVTPQHPCDTYIVPTPSLSTTMNLPELAIKEPMLPWRDEVLIDGGDRNLRVQVDQDWTVNGLDTEDTIAHFDTYAGKRLIQPSNRVGIYSPRFRAVRKVTNLVDAHSNMQMALVNDQTILLHSGSTDFSTTTVQNQQLQRNRLAMSANGFRDQTRGVNVDNVTHLTVFDNRFKLYEDLQIIRYGRYTGSEKLRLAEGIQRAATWSGDLEVLSTVSNLRLIEGNSVMAFAESIGIKNMVDKPALQLVKIANKLAAEVGEEVEFTLRFDNIGNQEIGNVTILDNLTGRLEYVPGSGQCSLDANLITELNEVGSTKLRWEITDPLAVGNGGIIRFICIVR